MLQPPFHEKPQPPFRDHENLPDPFVGEILNLADFYQSLWLAFHSVSRPDDAELARREAFHRGTKGLELPLVNEFGVNRCRHRSRREVFGLPRVGMRPHPERPLVIRPSAKESRILVIKL
jgi:hypothetical protein